MKIHQQKRKEALEKLRAWITKDQEIFGQLISTNGDGIYTITFMTPIIDDVNGKPTILPLDSYLSDIFGYRMSRRTKHAQSLILHEIGVSAIQSLAELLFDDRLALQYRYWD